MDRNTRLKNREIAVRKRKSAEWHHKRKAAPKKQADIRAQNRERQRKRREKVQNNPKMHAASKGRKESGG